MKKEIYSYPKSSFLSIEKDMDLIVSMIMKNNRLKKLLHYTSRDCLDKPSLTEDETVEMFGNEIKIVPKFLVDGSVYNYMIVNFNNFSPNLTNPEFRDNVIEFDIVCHYDQWKLKDFALRPYRIAAELDSMFNQQRLTGIGKLEFIGMSQIMLTDEFGGLCLLYQAVHGEEDKKFMLNPTENEAFVENFNSMFNEHKK